MECPSCQFQNIPGTRRCARCQSVLDFAEVCVEPPRAGVRVLGDRTRLAMFRVGAGLNERVAAIEAWMRSLAQIEVGWRAVGRTVVPGWGHRSIGARVRGWMLTLGWLPLLALAVYTQGGVGGWVCYFMVVGWHSFSFSHLLARDLARLTFGRRIIVGLLVYAAVNLGLYLPASYLVGAFVVPFRAEGINSGPVMRNGEVVIRTGAWSRPSEFRRGDVVVYRVPGEVIQPGVYTRAGYGIDRVLAVPGDRVEFGPGGLRVNGELLTEENGPIAPIAPAPMELVVEPGTYVILPSALRLYNAADAEWRNQLVRRTSRVPADMIDGKVLFRTRPLLRAGTLGFDAKFETRGSNP